MGTALEINAKASLPESEQTTVQSCQSRVKLGRNLLQGCREENPNYDYPQTCSDRRANGSTCKYEKQALASKLQAARPRSMCL